MNSIYSSHESYLLISSWKLFLLLVKEDWKRIPVNWLPCSRVQSQERWSHAIQWQGSGPSANCQAELHIHQLEGDIGWHFLIELFLWTHRRARHGDQRPQVPEPWQYLFLTTGLRGNHLWAFFSDSGLEGLGEWQPRQKQRHGLKALMGGRQHSLV